jgi:hypothetical protein
MSEESERVNKAVIETTTCPRCGAAPGDRCGNNRYLAHVKRYEQWARDGRPHTKLS